MEQIKNKPQLDKRIFWDVGFAKLDYNKKPAFVIERVFDRGDVDVSKLTQKNFPVSRF